MVDLAVAALLVLAAADGARRGFAFYSSEIVTLAIAAGAALAGFGFVANLFEQVLAVPPLFSRLAASLLILVVVHGLVQAVAHPAAVRLDRGIRHRVRGLRYRLLSALPGAVVAAMVVCLVLGGLEAVPSQLTRRLVGESASGGVVADLGLGRGPIQALLDPSARPPLGPA
ncbi:MAG TPA: CvpA family protein [Candidatus Dormibacteraeota bacterium]|nr:CvpA family protein [Candidatus Dormibacteraeota bacterium]